MAFRTINGTTYKVAVEGASGRLDPIEKRARALSGGLLVDNVADKVVVTEEYIGTSSGPFTIAGADAFIAVLRGGPLTVAGEGGSFTARARDIGWRNVKAAGGVKRYVTATLEQV